MYFILSKVLLFLLSPLYWIITLLLIACFTRRPKLRRRTALTGLVLLLIFSNPYLVNKVGKAWEWPEVNLPDTVHYSCAIVLGGFGVQDAKGEGHFDFAADRFIQAMRLQLTGKVSHILMSGGNGSLNPRDFSEGEWARGQLKQFRFADSTVLIEGKSRNTMENAQFSAALLKKSNLKPPYLLVTSAFHMRRAAMIFKRANVPIVPYSCNFIAGDTTLSIYSMTPDFGVITAWDLWLKEAVGYVVNSVMKTND
jgi:uncharacterized SAM-binding protein YcdF (DUF218 family)